MCVLAFTIRALREGRWAEEEKSQADNLNIGIFLLIIIWSGLMLTFPKLTTQIVLVFRASLCAFIVMGNMMRFEGNCGQESVEGRLKFAWDV